MAFLTIPHVKIRGVAAAVPKEIKEVSKLDCFAEGEAEKTIELTGIRESRLAPEGKVCSDYCMEAAEQLISKLGWEKNTIDALIYISVSRDYIEPNTATVIQGKMELPDTCYTIDLPMACSGYCYGLSVMGSLLSLGCMKRALMLVGDTPSKIMSPFDKTLWPLHGDAGTATALEYSLDAKPMFFNLMSDGKQMEAIIAPASGVREPIKNLLENFCIDVDEVDYLLLHQANQYIDEKIRKKMRFSKDKTPYCLEKFGNTSSGTIPMTMVTKISEQLRGGKNKLVMSGFGAGLSWAAVYVETEFIEVLPLIEI